MKVRLIGHYGSDLDVVNAARVSFSSESTEFTPRDEHLIKFLARGCTTKDWEELSNSVAVSGRDVCESGDADVYGDKYALQELLAHVKRMPRHWVPFANGGHATMHFKVPLFVARQLQKHTAGFNPWSEVSRRYVDSTPEFYLPTSWRGRSADKKQGSTGEIVTSCVHDKDGELTHPRFAAADVNELALATYQNMIDGGVCPEQARMVLPQNMYTEMTWGGNLYAWCSLYNTRSYGDTQAETANVAQQIKAIVEPLFPVSWKALTE